MLYADNIVLYKDMDLETNLRDVESVQNDLTRIIVWCSTNELTTNVKKTKTQFSLRNRNVDCKLFEQQHVIKINDDGTNGLN